MTSVLKTKNLKSVKTFCFSTFNDYAPKGIGQALKTIYNSPTTPIILCVGSDLVIGDSLGPLCGTMLKSKNINSFIYGTLKNPITAKEMPYISTYLKKTHPSSPIITIDAAVGNNDDIGLIKVINKGIKPGLGVNKDFETLGDLSIIGIIASKTKNNHALYSLTRLNLVYKTATMITDGVVDFLSSYQNKTHFA